MSDIKLHPVNIAAKAYLVKRVVQYERLVENATALKTASEHFTDFFKWLDDIEQAEGVGE